MNNGRKPNPRKNIVTSPFFRRSEVIKLLCGEGMVLRCEKAGWLKARVRRAKYVIYRREDVMAILARLDAGEYPE